MSWLVGCFLLILGFRYGDRFEDEIDGSLLHTGAGILSMANSGPNTNSSQVRICLFVYLFRLQFFVTLGPTQHLDGKHTIFGRISAGMKVRCPG